MSHIDYLKKVVLDICLLKGEFKLRSGQISNTYFDKYRLESDPNILSPIVNEMVKNLNTFTHEIEILGGLETGGIAVATLLSYKAHIPMIIVRKKAKEYGTCKFAEGSDFAGKNLLIVEDVITTGGQVLISAEMLKNAGANIIGVTAILTRSKQGVENIEQKLGVPVLTVFDFSEEV